MNICVVCGKEFKPDPNYIEKKTCSEECLRKYMRKLSLTNKNFLANSFKKGDPSWNKGIENYKDLLSEESYNNISKTHIQYQEGSTSPYAKIEGRFLPHNTYQKGTITKRSHKHNKGKYKGKVETEYYINIDWKGNRKPNNLYRRYLWEYYNKQDIPKGYVVICKDGNPDNLLISNLCLITRSELLRLNAGKN